MILVNTDILPRITKVHSYSPSEGRRLLLPMMGYTGMLRPKGVPFQVGGISKGGDFRRVEV